MPGAVDLHLHGAFGIDLMVASPRELDDLARQLGDRGVAGFCPTTLSSPPDVLLEAVARLGAWIQSFRGPGAKPLGIHLEGPFISPAAAGAHPPDVLRPAQVAELESLWEASHQTLKLITIAPEACGEGVTAWAKKHRIILSAGHSRATQAAAAFEAGFTGVTHAWNAAGFHQREPGVLGAAIGRKDVFLELIVDGVHVDPTVIRWTRKLHPVDRICFVSDCAPAAGVAPGQKVAFGPLQIEFKDGASRLPNGSLAGGGVILPEAYQSWLRAESEATGVPIKRIHARTVKAIQKNPLQYLNLKRSVLSSFDSSALRT